MNLNIKKYKEDLKGLLKEGEYLSNCLKVKNGLTSFREKYEEWYTESLSLISIVLPNRKNDFILYYNNPKGDGLRVAINYTPGKFIQGNDLGEWNIGSYTNPPTQKEIAISLFGNQLTLLKSVQRRFESSLFDIKQVVQADIFDSELDAALELNKKGYVRGAGAIAGVVLEGHLGQVCENHKITIRKKHPTINDFNQLLKDNDILETQTWRFIQHLADLRNLCDHKREQEPMKIDIEELIKGVDKISKTLF